MKKLLVLSLLLLVGCALWIWGVYTKNLHLNEEIITLNEAIITVSTRASEIQEKYDICQQSIEYSATERAAVYQKITEIGGQTTYTDPVYGFSLNFPTAREGYTVMREGTSIGFGFPERAGIFFIIAYTHKDRQHEKDVYQGGPLGEYLGENKQYVFVYHGPQDGFDSNDSLMPLRFFQLTSIKSTFSIK